MYGYYDKDICEAFLLLQAMVALGFVGHPDVQKIFSLLRSRHLPDGGCSFVFFTVYAAMHECAGLLDDIHYALRVAVSELFVGAGIPIVVILIETPFQGYVPAFYAFQLGLEGSVFLGEFFFAGWFLNLWLDCRGRGVSVGSGQPGQEVFPLCFRERSGYVVDECRQLFLWHGGCGLVYGF
nr:hypothetical protein [uncultured Acetatifactor sp.]